MTSENSEGFTTRIIHHDRRFSKTQPGENKYCETHVPTCNSVLFSYSDAVDLCDVFQGKAKGHSYARQSTPTSSSLESLIALCEGGVNCLTFSTGMAAISAIMLTLLQQGDHLIASRYLFGNTFSFLNSLVNLGIQVSFVDTCDSSAVKNAIQSNTKMVFTETLANPGTQIPDFNGLAALCNENDFLFVIDGTLTTGYIAQGKDLGAHLMVLSLTKSFNGHGNVLGGAVVDMGTYDWSSYPNIFPAYQKGDPNLWGLQQIRKKGLRDMGGTLSATAAAQIAMGVETLALRLQRSCENARQLALVLQQHDKVSRVFHPSLDSHPQAARAKQHFRLTGNLLSLNLAEGYDAVAFLNSMELVVKATHLGDNRTLALPVAQTIFFEMGEENRKAQGIAENMIRCSIGIEDTADLIHCFIDALDQLVPVV